jgi:1-acyl-sn-glycerol-3-phosphate acyltransferase
LNAEPSSQLFVRGFRFCRLLLHFATGMLKVALVYPHISVERQRDMVQRWAHKLLSVLNIELRIQGELPAGVAMLLASNHISWLDNFVIHSLCPAHFVAKSEIRDWPVMGWLVAHTGALFIERARRHHTLKINQDMMAALARGESVALFPEGSTGTGDHIKPFHSSLLQAAVGGNCVVAPIGLRYVAPNGLQTHAADYVGDTNFLTSLQSILAMQKIVAQVYIGAAISAAEKNRRELALEAQSAIAGLLQVEVRHTKL